MRRRARGAGGLGLIMWQAERLGEALLSADNMFSHELLSTWGSEG